ncbi:MAG: cell division protein ZipA [Nevskiales bacterium]
MNWVQWLLLILGVVSVLVMVVIARRRPPEGPWTGADEETPKLPEVDLADGTGPQAPTLDDGEAPAAATTGRRAPAFRMNDGDEAAWSTFTPRADPASSVRDVAAEPEETLTPVEQKVILLHVINKTRTPYSGPELHRALGDCRLRFGMQDFYHRTTEVNGAPESVFSVASMIKPGTLDPMAAQELKTPGLTFFLVLPGPVEGLRAFREMLDTAQDLAAKLKADLLDEHRQPLTSKSVQAQLEDIARRERRR